MEVVARRQQRSHKACKRERSSSSDNSEVVHVPVQKKIEKCQKKEKKSISLEKKATPIKELKINRNRADSESHIDQQQESHTQLGRPKRVRKITEKAEEELKSKQNKAKSNKQSKSQKLQQNEEANKTLLGDSTTQKQQERISSRLRCRLLKMAKEGYVEEDEEDKNNDEIQEQTSQFNDEERIDSQSKKENNEKKDEEQIVRKQKNIRNLKHKKQVKQEEAETDEECQHQENKEEQDDNQPNQLDFNDNREIGNINKENDSVVEIEIQQIEVEELTVKVENEKLDIEEGKETNPHTICKGQSCESDLKQEEEGSISEKDKSSEKQTQNNTFSLPKSEEIEDPQPQQEEKQANEENQLLVKQSSDTKLSKKESKKTKKQAKNLAHSRKSCTLDDQADVEEEQRQQNDEDYQEYDQFDEGISPHEIPENQDNNTQTITIGKARKMPWSEEEDKLVIKLVELHGPMKWTFIAQHIPGRIGKQCRERWHNHLNPRIKKSAWSDEEEWLLFLCHKLKGNRWAEITLCMTGRTDNAIKNHWNSSMKKRLPQLCQRYSLLRRGEIVEYTISEHYSELEKSFLSQLLALPDDDSDQLYQKQVLQDSKFPQQPSISNGLSSNKTNKSIEQSSQNQESQFVTQKLKEKQQQKLAKSNLQIENSPSLLPSAARTASHFKKQSEHTPATNNNNRNLYDSSEQQQPNTADCSGDVKEIIQRIPQSPVQFDEFKKQILLLSSQDEAHQFSSLHLKELSPRDNQKQDQQQSPSVDISWSDTKNLERILSTPMQVQRYVENNPQFADIIRAALNYPKISQFNTNTVPEEKKPQTKQNKQQQKFTGSDILQSEDSKGCLEGLEKSSEHEENNDELQVIDNKKNMILSQKQTKEIEKKATKKRVKNQQIIIDDENNNGDVNSRQPSISQKGSKAAMKQQDSNQGIKPSTKQSKKSQKQKILPHGSVPYLHPLYVMNHPYYDPTSVQYTGYPNPVPVSLNQSESSNKKNSRHANSHSKETDNPPPPHHLVNPNFLQPQFHRNPPQSNPTSSQQQQHHQKNKTKRTSHHLQQQQQLSSSHQSMYNHSKSQEIQDDTYQTPMKYQKNNSSKRNILRNSNLAFKQQFQQSPLRDSNKARLSNSRNLHNSNHLVYNISDELNFSDNELNNQHTNPFDGQNSNPNSFMKENTHPNRSSMHQSNNKTNSSHHRMNSSSYNHHPNHNEGSNNLQYFTTPNKYQTPSKLLDFDSDVHLNGGSIDHYFNMGVFSSHKKINRSQHSAFKCFPNTPNNHNIHKSPF